MRKLLVLFALAALAPLGGCATPYGYSPGAWANYDGDYDWGQDGYDRPVSYYGQGTYSAPPNAGSYYVPDQYAPAYAGVPGYGYGYGAPASYGPPPGYYSTGYGDPGGY
jgi:hypothetical protein